MHILTANHKHAYTCLQKKRRKRRKRRNIYVKFVGHSSHL